MHNVNWANHKIVYWWLFICAHAMFDTKCCPAFLGALDNISSVLCIYVKLLLQGQPPHSEGGLYIIDAQYWHQGMYTCSATTQVDSAQAEAVLKVSGLYFSLEVSDKIKKLVLRYWLLATV